MAQVTIGGGRVVCEMDEAAQDEYKQVVGWLQKAVAERDAIRDQRDTAQAQRNDAYAALKTALDERAAARAEATALREQVLRLRDASESVAQNMEASGALWSSWHTQIAIARLRDALNMTAGDNSSQDAA